MRKGRKQYRKRDRSQKRDGFRSDSLNLLK